MKFLPCVLFLCFLFFSISGWSQISPKQGALKPAVNPVKPKENPAKAIPSVPVASPDVAPAVTPKKKTVNNGQITLIWGTPNTYKADENTPAVKYLNLKGGIYNPKNHLLPEFFKTIKLNTGSNSATAVVLNTIYQPLTNVEMKALDTNKKWVAIDIAPKVKVLSTRNAFYVDISFIPLRKNTLTNTYEKLVSFTLDIHQSKEPVKPKHAAVSFAANSVLNTGTWFRIGVTTDGIYKLNASFFVKAGIDTAKLVPKNIRIYGNGGAMLPQSNKAYRPDDLIENAIYVQGQTDTSFRKNDYVLFYGQSPNTWAYDSSDGHFHHTVNVYSDTTFYFINIDLGPGKRIVKEASLISPPTNTVSTFDDYAYHELDGVNLLQSGNEWMGEYFETTTQYNFSFPFANISNSGPVYVNTAITSVNCSASGSYLISSSGSASVSDVIGGVPCCFDCNPYAITGTESYTYTPVPGSANVPVTITKQTASAIGWLYYIETNVRRQLTLPSTQTQMEFRDTKSAGAGNISLFTVSSSTPIHVWDITNPQNIDSVSFLSSGGGTYNFELSSNMLKQYIAFTNKTNSYLSPVYFGKVENQNLHAMPQADMVIVTNPDFLEQADQLANFHRNHDNLKVNVVTTQQVYNEFSSGVQDPTAIRDFMRMFYDRATNYATSPKYLLLFGGGSYDPKRRIQDNTNYVVSYESNDSFDPEGSYVSDDYFALLDSDVTTPPDGASYPLDISVGRFTVDNTAQAQACVNKVIRYETPSGQSATTSTNCCNSQNDYTLGNWRNTICFIAHDGSGNAFETASESMSAHVNANYKNLNVNKIYLDAYQIVQTPGGLRYPSVNAAIDNQMNQGLLVYNFEGHGGPTGLAYERVLDVDDINSWTNLYAMPLFFNGSCNFGEWDNPGIISGGQLSVNLPTGGVIGMISATRAVFLDENTGLNEVFIDTLYGPLPDGSLPRIGDLLTMAVNGYGGTQGGGDVNNLTYSLIGDPAVRLNYPNYNVHTTSVTTASHDTLKALAKVTISGNIEDNSGNVISTFNGLLYPTIYDKPDSITTLANLGPADPGPTGYGPSFPITFGIQNSELYKGLISVNNGKFTFTYVMPKDILYYYGYGKISYYAQNSTTDAAGNDGNIIVGGTSPFAHNNGIGPKVRLYMNDSNFAFGGLTNQNPSLYAIVFDSNGINTSGSSIGHSITAVLDNNTANTYDLTNYYTPSLNSYQKGTITYPFSLLSDGTHALSLRVWNVYDNTSLASTEFSVQPQSNLQLQHVLNYPDPFTTHTQFFFEINEVCDQMDVQIQIFSVSGKLVKNILTSVKTDSFRSEPISWDGRDDYGDRIAKGVYIYHIKVRTSTGTTADTYQKLVIL